MQVSMQRPSVLGNLPSGEPGIAATLQIMRRLVRENKRNTAIRDAAIDLTRDLRPKDWAGEIRAVFEYVRDHIRYVRDVTGVETLQTPEATIDIGAGDCDDKSTLLASMLESIGHPTRFVAVGYRATRAYSHVYVETKLGAKWLALDATVLQPFGWSPRPPIARMTVHN